MATISENNPKLVAVILPVLISLSATATTLGLAGWAFGEKYATKDYVDSTIVSEAKPNSVIVERLEKAVYRLEQLAFEEAKQSRRR